MAQAIEVLQDAGATIVRANIPTIGLDRRARARPWPCSTAIRSAATRATPAPPPIVFLYELKHDLNLYLRDWATARRSRRMADIIAFNQANADKALRFGQDLFLAAAGDQGRPLRARIQVGAGDGPAWPPRSAGSTPT